MQPPPLPGDRPGSRRPRRLGVLAAVVIVVAVLLMAGIAWTAWRVLAAGSGDDGGHATRPLRILPVTATTPGACPSGGPGTASSDGKTCYRLSASGMTVRKLESVRAEPSQVGNGWQILLELNPDDARRFGDLTREHRGGQLALVTGGKVIAAPRVQEPITGGKLQIAGNFTSDEAKKIAENLPS